MRHCYEIKGTHRQRSYANRLDIIIINNQEKICIQIDVAVTTDRNVTENEGGRKKETKIQGFILVIIGAMGVVTKGLKNN